MWVFELKFSIVQPGHLQPELFLGKHQVGSETICVPFICYALGRSCCVAEKYMSEFVAENEVAAEWVEVVGEHNGAAEGISVETLFRARNVEDLDVIPLG